MRKDGTAGTVVKQFFYTPFGSVIPLLGNVNRTKFIGKEKDKESNYADHGVRKYDDEIGRFTSIDPLWEKYYSLTPYQYAGNNPVIALDKEGEAVQFAAAAIGAIIGAGFEYANQVIDNFQKSNEPNLFNKIIDAGTKNIDMSDIGISATAGVLAGLTGGLSWLAAPTNVYIGVVADYAQSQTGTKTEEFGVEKLATSALGNIVGESVGKGIYKGMQESAEGIKLNKTANKFENSANKSGNFGLTQRANNAKNKAGIYGVLQSTLGGVTTTTFIFGGINYSFSKKENNK